MFAFIQVLISMMMLIGIYYMLERIVDNPATHRRFQRNYHRFMRQSRSNGYEDESS